MKIEQNLKITFSREEIFAMCVEKCQRIESAVEGEFEAASSYYGTGEVICTLIPKSDGEPLALAPLVPIPVPPAAPTEDVIF